MDLDKFLYNSLLNGFTIMGINNKNLERISLRQLVVEKKQELFRVLYEYFELGLRAGIFGNGGKLSGSNDRLWTGFNHGPYVYFVHRQPQPKKSPTPQFNPLLNNIPQRKKKDKVIRLMKS
ncbi:hypothetical protein LCGC14_1927480 [marine sediment metagenome]|uniref:Uncharacterized protein n=1 Tax=marine sediment metagenome TaxID=412755 RepID=A0A0F9FNX4_9ZZZZ